MPIYPLQVSIYIEISHHMADQKISSSLQWGIDLHACIWIFNHRVVGK